MSRSALLRLGLFLPITLMSAPSLGEASSLALVPTDIEAYVGEQPVRSFIRDASGNTWLGTQSGLFRLHEASNASSPIIESRDTVLGFTEVVELSLTTSGTLVATSWDGVHYAYNRSFDDFEEINADHPGEAFNASPGITRPSAYPMDNNYRDSGQSSDGDEARSGGARAFNRKLYSTNFGLCGVQSNALWCGLNENNNRRTLIFEPPNGARILAHDYLTAEDTFVVFLEDGVASLVPIEDPSTATTRNIDALAGLEIRALTQLRDGSILVGTDDGLFGANEPKGSFSKIYTGRHNRLTGVVETENQVWILSESGICLLMPSLFDGWPQAGSTPIEVLSFAQETNGNTFVGTYQGIYVTKPNSIVHQRVWPDTDTSLDSRITSLSYKAPMLYAGTFSDGLQVFSWDNLSGTLEHLNSYIPSAGITVLAATADSVIVGTANSGLMHIESGTVRAIPLPTSWRQNPSPITSISFIDERQWLVTTENEVMILCTESDYAICGSQVVSIRSRSPRLLSSLVKRDGSIWLGSLYMGLFKTSLTDLKALIPPKRAFPKLLLGVSIYNLMSSGSEGIWLGTNRGLLQAGSSAGELRTYGRSHGLLNTDFNHGANFGGKDITPMIGGPSGYNLLPDPSELMSTGKPAIWLKNLQTESTYDIPKRLLISAPSLKLGTEPNFFSATVSLNDLRSVARNEYEFTLDGYDKDWLHSNRNTITYSNLPAGDYVFRARGTDSAGNKSVNEISINVHVAGPVWQTWWAILLYALAALLLGAIAKKAYDRHLISKARLEFAENKADAFERLEYAYQDQLELNQRLVQRQSPAAHELLGTIETAFDAIAAEDNAALAPPLISMGEVSELLHDVENIAERTSTREFCDLRSLTEQVIARLASAFPAAASALILNDVTPQKAPLKDARYLTIIAYELLKAVSLRREFQSPGDALITVSADWQNEQKDGTNRLLITVTDNGTPQEDSRLFDASLAVSHHLTESLGGSVRQEPALENRLEVSLELGS